MSEPSQGKKEAIMSFTWKRTIKVRVMEAFGVLIVVVATLLANMYVRLGDIAGAQEHLDRVHTLAQEAERLRSAVLDMQTAIAGAALSRDHEMMGRGARADYERALGASKRMTELERRFAGAAPSAIGTVGTDLELRYQVGERMVAAYARGRDPGEKAAVEYNAIRVAVLGVIDDGMEDLDRLYAEGSMALSRSTRGLGMTLLGSVAAILLAGVCAAFMLARQLARPLRLVRESVERLSEGDLTHRADFRDSGELGDLVTRINGLTDQLKNVVTGMIDSAANISSGSRQVARGVDDLSRSADEQSTRLEGAATSMQAAGSAARQGAYDAAGMDRLIKEALEATAAGGGLVNDAAAAMADIEESGGRIAGTAVVMDEIASRANLLALKAVVEAARAGDRDGDFAEVAAEAHELAQRSAALTKEIKGLIANNLEKVKLGRQLVDQSRETLHRVITSVGEAAGNVADVSESSREQSAGLGRINQAMVRMDEMARQNALLVDQAAAATRMMEEEACRLLERIACFRMHRTPPPVATGGRKRRFGFVRRLARNEMIGASAL